MRTKVIFQAGRIAVNTLPVVRTGGRVFKDRDELISFVESKNSNAEVFMGIQCSCGRNYDFEHHSNIPDELTCECGLSLIRFE